MLLQHELPQTPEGQDLPAWLRMLSDAKSHGGNSLTARRGAA